MEAGNKINTTEELLDNLIELNQYNQSEEMYRFKDVGIKTKYSFYHQLLYLKQNNNNLMSIRNIYYFWII